MALVTYKDLCIDAVDPHAVAPFWAHTIGLQAELFDDDGDARLYGSEPALTIWLNSVPEPRTVKQRAHIDVFAASMDEFADAPKLSAEGEFSWTVIADPEGGELCVFVQDDPPAYRFKDLSFDTADPAAISQWWGEVIGGRVIHEDGYSYLDDIPGIPWDDVGFVQVPEPKTVKNRIHWDVRLVEGASLDDLIEKGATLLRAQDAEIRWNVMADPDGNEFCVFAAS